MLISIVSPGAAGTIPFTSAISLRSPKTFPFLNRYLPKQREKINPRKGERNV